MKIEFSPRVAAKNKKVCAAAADALFSVLGQAAKMQVDINFVSENEIKSLNNTFRGIDSATDTLSFPFISLAAGEIIDGEKYAYQRDPATKRIQLGEIYLNEERIQKQANEYGHGFERELAYLTAHSLLHLFGYNHDDTETEKTMSALCEKITTSAGYQK